MEKLLFTFRLDLLKRIFSGSSLQGARSEFLFWEWGGGGGGDRIPSLEATLPPFPKYFRELQILTVTPPILFCILSLPPLTTTPRKFLILWVNRNSFSKDLVYKRFFPLLEREA